MHALQPPPSVLVLDLVPDERNHLLALLDGLPEAGWERPTACPGWSVRDVALHLLADDVGLLSRMRDGFRAESPRSGEELVAFINRLNDAWLHATRRISGRVACDLLRLTGEQTHAYFRSLDPLAVGSGVVSWAGPDPAPNWLWIAREYTERWVHQQQIREAVGAPLLTERRLFGPVLATFMRALPHAFRDVDAPSGTTVTVNIVGESGGRWSVVRTDVRAWALSAGPPTAAVTASISMDQDLAWRLFTRGLSERQAAAGVRITGDAHLGGTVLRTVAIVA